MSHHSSLPLNAMYRLMRYAGTYQRIMELHCNDICPYKHETVAGDDVCLKAERIRERINAELDVYDCKGYFQGDPHGCCVKIVVPDGYTNDWGREGICVPA